MVYATQYTVYCYFHIILLLGKFIISNCFQSPLEARSISIQDVTMETVGIERTIEAEQSATVWNTYFLPDG